MRTNSAWIFQENLSSVVRILFDAADIDSENVGYNSVGRVYLLTQGNMPARMFSQKHFELSKHFPCKK